MTCQKSSGAWPKLQSYLAQPFMQSRRYGRGWMSCYKLTMHWGPCWKAWNSSELYPHQSPQRLWDWQAYMTQMHYAIAMAWPTALGLGRRAWMRGHLSTTSGWCTIGLAWCAKNVTTAHQPHQIPSAATASRTANPQETEAPVSHPHLDNCQQEAYGVNLS